MAVHSRKGTGPRRHDSTVFAMASLKDSSGVAVPVNDEPQIVLYHQWSRLWSQLSQIRARGAQPFLAPRLPPWSS